MNADVANRQVIVLDIDAPPLFADVLEFTPLRSSNEPSVRLFAELLNAEMKNWGLGMSRDDVNRAKNCRVFQGDNLSK